MESMKHAYLIIAHNQPTLLQKLLELIDDERNDIYIHIDAKSNIQDFSNLKVQKSKIYFTERINVIWGHINQIKAEMLLFKTAHQNEKYFYYHLISGVDLVLKTQDEIHNFFKNNNFEYLGFADFNDSRKEIELRTRYYHILTYFGKNKNPFLRYTASFVRKTFILIQKTFHLKRKRNLTFYSGTNWCSVTNNFVELLLSKEEEIYQTYKYTVCCDELYKQTVIANSNLKEKVYKCDNQFDQCLLEIDWKRGNPYTYTNQDYELLINSKNIFARKFSEENMEIINKVSAYVKGKNND